MQYFSDKKPAHEPGRSTLEKRYPIKYRYPALVPVQFIIHGNTLKIRIFVRYSENMFQFFPGTTITYADIAEAGIRRNWMGKYPFPWIEDDGYERSRVHAHYRVLTEETDISYSPDIRPDAPSVRATLEFIRYQSPEAINYFPEQRFIRVSMRTSRFSSAEVTSPLWRWVWGFFRSGQWEALNFNWSRKHPGRVHLSKRDDRQTFQQQCAHEFGHIVGIGDAYAANYRYFYEAPNTTDFMMNNNKRVHPQEIEMALYAHATNKMQYFPKRFSWKSFWTGYTRLWKI
ncbi:MAG TPA: hypothetical protein PKV44_00050 [Bacillota bacterium]|nr:hypothetical protein [Bacillota bacterium]